MDLGGGDQCFGLVAVESDGGGVVVVRAGDSVGRDPPDGEVVGGGVAVSGVHVTVWGPAS
ncbi:MAG: hypothetical protein JWQ60_4864, partial [Pseudonocardia sp.]|nr:hypothetical protein [Pseudonocardia sp.]